MNIDFINLQKLSLLGAAIKIKGCEYEAYEIIKYLTDFVSPERQKRINEVLSRRTYSVCTVLDGLCDAGNISAVFRSAESFGFHFLNIIENAGDMKLARKSASGAKKWLDIRRWGGGVECVEYLKADGYKICATYIGPGTCDIADIDFSQKTALVFGNEHAGVSRQILDRSDYEITYPMHGFTTSFNISVAAALCFAHVYQDRVGRLGSSGDFKGREKDYFRALYTLRSVKNADLLLEKLKNKSE